MSGLSHRLRAVLSADTGLTVLLVSLSVVLFVVYPFLHLGGLGQLAVTVGTTAILIAGSFSLSQKHLRMAAWGVALVALAAHWARYVMPHAAADAVANASTIAFLVLICYGTLARVMRPSGRVTGHHVQGAIAVYLMLGLIWGYAYAFVELRQPGSFNLPDTGVAEESDRSGVAIRDLVYFSFVTLTTLGYGDVTPKSQSARTLATLEALIGQLYLVTLIASLVSLRAAGGRNGAAEPDGRDRGC